MGTRQQIEELWESTRSIKISRPHTHITGEKGRKDRWAGSPSRSGINLERASRRGRTTWRRRGQFPRWETSSYTLLQERRFKRGVNEEGLSSREMMTHEYRPVLDCNSRLRGRKADTCVSLYNEVRSDGLSGRVSRRHVGVIFSMDKVIPSVAPGKARRGRSSKLGRGDDFYFVRAKLASFDER